MNPEFDESLFEAPIFKIHDEKVSPIIKGITLRRMFLKTSSLILPTIENHLDFLEDRSIGESNASIPMLTEMAKSIQEDANKYLNAQFDFNINDKVSFKNELKVFNQKKHVVEKQISDLESELSEYCKKNNVSDIVKKGFEYILNISKT